MPTFSIPSLQSTLYLCAVFIPACLWGTLFYAAIVWARGEMQKTFMTITLMLVATPSFVVLVLTGGFGLWPLLVVMLLCLVPAHLEKRLDADHLKWAVYFTRLFAATSGSIVLGLGVLYVVRTPIDSVLASDDANGLMLWPIRWSPLLVLVAGLLLTPSALSCLRWIIHTSKRRPGLDKPLESDEHLG